MPMNGKRVGGEDVLGGGGRRLTSQTSSDTATTFFDSRRQAVERGTQMVAAKNGVRIIRLRRVTAPVARTATTIALLRNKRNTAEQWIKEGKVLEGVAEIRIRLLPGQVPARNGDLLLGGVVLSLFLSAILD